MIRKLVTAGLLALLAGSLSPRAARADDLRFYAYDPDTEAARHRTQGLILVIKPGLLSSKVVKLYRRRGADLELKGSDGSVGGGRLDEALGSADAEGLRVYLVDPVQGKGFAQGACKGAEKAWIAVKPVKPYENLRLFVLTYDAAAKRAQLCETLDYHWRGEWQVPDRKLPHFFNELGPAGDGKQ